jgi:hypothetical protein
MSEHADDGDVEYDEESGIYRTTYDQGRVGPTVRVLEAVAAIRNTEPTELAPLDEYVEPDALDTVFEPTRAKAGTHGSLSFAYEGLHVVVHSDGEIELREQA